jgi:orotate phosphoribosyltransferase
VVRAVLAAMAVAGVVIAAATATVLSENKCGCLERFEIGHERRGRFD